MPEVDLGAALVRSRSDAATTAASPGSGGAVGADVLPAVLLNVGVDGGDVVEFVAVTVVGTAGTLGGSGSGADNEPDALTGDDSCA